jgi:FAD-linked oxidoreductase
MSITRRRFVEGSLLAAMAAHGFPSKAHADETLPWRNWSGGLEAHPVGRFAPSTEAELIEFMRTTRGQLRPVGAGHSFTPLVPTDGHLVIVDKIAGLLDHDGETMQATFGAGTRLGDMGAPLEAVGQAMLNLPDIDRQTLAGAISTATHGTGIGFNTLAAYVTELRLITAEGDVLDIDASDTDLFDAARVSLGALGILTRVRMQNRDAYRLKHRDWSQKTEEVLESFPEQARAHRHFEMFPLTHSDYALVQAIDETDEPVDNPPPDPAEQSAFAEAMRAWMALPPGDRRPHINAMAVQITPSERVDASYEILTNVRNNRFNEMEYSVPVEAGADCLREILATITEREIDVVFPLEYRYIKGDDLWLSMFEGGDRAAISIHRTAAEDYRAYFDTIEPIFWKHGGRPHWGKVNSLGAAELTALYPRFEAFRELRAELDPHGRLLNPHLRKVFGV